MKKLLATILLIAVFFSCQKQEKEVRTEPRTFGAIGNLDKDYALLKKPVKPPKPPKGTTPPADTVVTPPPVDTVVITPPVPLPASVSLWMPPVMNQGSEGACSAFAVAFARSSEYYYQSGKSVPLSPEFLFNQTKTGNCASSAILVNLNLLVAKGVCTLSSMPYSWTNGCSLQPTQAQFTEALTYKIKDYTMIAASDIQGLKKALYEHHALVIQVTPDNQFVNAGPGFVWTSHSGALGSHAIVVCGYDDAKGAFKIINSWGTNWGDGGYSWISYEFFPNISSSAIKLIL